MIKNKHLITKIGPVYAVGTIHKQQLLRVDVWSDQVTEEHIAGYYDECAQSPWMMFDRHKGFTTPYSYDFSSHTSLQQQLLKQISSIPLGKSQTYQEVGVLAGSRYWARAVGQVCSSNKFPLLIPCHRVLGKTNPWLYSGNNNETDGEYIKKSLLRFEQETLLS